jgi:Flp pilus assembly protein TadD
VIVCPACNTKIRAGRSRCPRCRLKLDAAPRGSRINLNRAAPIALGLLGVAALAAGIGLWRQSGDAPVLSPAPSAAPQVTAAPTRAQLAAPAEASTAPGASQIPFIEPNRQGGLAYEDGDYAGALALYQEAVERNPEDAESWSNLGQVLVRLDRVAEAIPHFERAIALQRQRWAYHFNLARARGLLGLWPEAIDGYREAQRLFPDDYATAFNLGLALRQVGDDAGAVEQFQRAIALDPDEPTFQLSLAMSYERLGRKQEATAAYQKTLELAPEAPEAAQIRARLERLLH